MSPVLGAPEDLGPVGYRWWLDKEHVSEIVARTRAHTHTGMGCTSAIGSRLHLHLHPFHHKLYLSHVYVSMGLRRACKTGTTGWQTGGRSRCFVRIRLYIRIVELYSRRSHYSESLVGMLFSLELTWASLKFTNTAVLNTHTHADYVCVCVFMFTYYSPLKETHTLNVALLHVQLMCTHAVPTVCVHISPSVPQCGCMYIQTHFKHCVDWWSVLCNTMLYVCRVYKEKDLYTQHIVELLFPLFLPAYPVVGK